MARLAPEEVLCQEKPLSAMDVVSALKSCTASEVKVPTLEIFVLLHKADEYGPFRVHKSRQCIGTFKTWSVHIKPKTPI